MILEEKVQLDEKGKQLLKSPKWLTLCEEINTQTTVRVHGNNWNDTYVAGFRDDVTKAIEKLNTFLENDCIKEEHFVCPSDIVRRYLVELCEADLRSIGENFKVKIEKGKGNKDIDISGNKEGLRRVRKDLNALINIIKSKSFDVKQPGLGKYFDSGRGDRLVRSVEKEHDCVIQVQKNVQKDDDKSATEDSASSSKDDNNDDNNNGDDNNEATTSGTDACTLITTHGHQISWKPVYIEAEKVTCVNGFCAYKYDIWKCEDLNISDEKFIRGQ